MNLEFLRLPFSKSVAVRLFANMHVCISVHNTKMTAILEKVSILNILLAIQFFQKVALTEAYILYHYCGNEHRTGMAVILKNGFHPEF